jgi:hypothetical protein
LGFRINKIKRIYNKQELFKKLYGQQRKRRDTTRLTEKEIWKENYSGKEEEKDNAVAPLQQRNISCKKEVDEFGEGIN